MREDFENAVGLLSHVSELIINLAGNNQIREKAIRDTELEKVNPYCISIEPDEVIEVLHEIEYLKITLSNAAEWADYIEKKAQ